MRKVRVALGEESYDIVIGYGLEQELRAFVQGAGFSRQAMLVTDSNVGPLYGENVRAILEAGGHSVTVVTIPAGESSKSLAVAEKLYTRAIELGLDRKSPIFALGGGVVGDLAGFIAATYMRGVPFVQLPTSLLAQVDSSVGGKVAVNHALGKNLIGAFYQPEAVFMDLAMMETLPKREIYTGLGEIIKYGIIYDADFFSYLEQHADAVLALEQEAAVHMIARDQGGRRQPGREGERPAPHPELWPHDGTCHREGDGLPALQSRRGCCHRHGRRGGHQCSPRHDRCR